MMLFFPLWYTNVLRIALAVVAAMFACHSNADEVKFSKIREASTLIQHGEVRSGLEILRRVHDETDQNKDPDLFFNISISTYRILSEADQDYLALDVLLKLLTSRIPEKNVAYREIAGAAFGAALMKKGDTETARRILSRVIMRGDERVVLKEWHRKAAVTLAHDQAAEGKIAQATLLFRRALLGAANDSDVQNEELADLLTDYAEFLVEIRKFSDATSLYQKLSTIYDGMYPILATKRLKFLASYLEFAVQKGDF